MYNKLYIIYNLVIAKEIEKGSLEGITLHDFKQLRASAIFREIFIKFKKEIKLKSETIPFLIFEVIGIKDIRGKYSKATIKFNGFCQGSASAVIITPDLVTDVLNSKLNR